MEELRRRKFDRRTPPGLSSRPARARVAQRILLAEPDPALAEMYRAALEADRWAVDVVSDGHTALTRAETTRPGLLLLSTLPDLPAMTVLRRLRDKEPTRDLAVIVLTNFGDEADEQGWLELGALGRLVKSRGMREKLSETIATLLERRTATVDRRVPKQSGPKASGS